MEEIPKGWAAGGVGTLLFYICAKWVFPLIQSGTDAARARQETDATIHNLYKEGLEQMSRLTSELASAQIRIASMTANVEMLTQKLDDAEVTVRRLTQRLAELEGK